jgi:hypothetical protein
MGGKKMRVIETGALRRRFFLPDSDDIDTRAATAARRARGTYLAGRAGKAYNAGSHNRLRLNQS